ncbi:YeeE/YedE family protein [Halosquirtibacter xylanolyticus]|uniref:YeeE/YedE thiosulfate transporter family protein n=1 Tax=Halosquirtibacter xylanolyticus TaxID=3374599 RepID=UPI00374814EF|nr:YeeE/YedE family protein [Prolixibacteraceae bacterium]
MGKIPVIIAGIIFGWLMQYASVNKFNSIAGCSILKNYTVPKLMLSAIGIGSILFAISIQLGWTTFHIKPLITGSIVLGGLLFGIGMAILGSCPGSIIVSSAQGSVDAMIGLLGGLLGALSFSFILPLMPSFLNHSYGNPYFAMYFSSHASYTIVISIIGILMLIAANLIHRTEGKNQNRRWLISGITLGVINNILLLKPISNRPIGASTAYTYISGVLTNTQSNNYWQFTQTTGDWELLFLISAFISVFSISIYQKSFRLKLMDKSWIQLKGSSKTKRVIWAFIGGFLLLLGARMARGCTSGHIISGMMQGALSSTLFGITMFASFLTTGHLFYRKNR